MDVVCVGAAVVDLFSPTLDHLPVSGEAIFVDDLPLFVGGGAANTAIGLAKLGLNVGLVTRLGHDIFAEYIIQYVSRYGVDVTRVTRSASLPSSRSIALPVKGEDRRTIHSLGANVEFGPKDIDLEYIRSARAVFLGAVGEGMDLDTLGSVLRCAREVKALTFLNISMAAKATGLTLARLEPLIRDSGVLILSKDEGAFLTRSDSMTGQADKLLSCGATLVVITDSRNGTLAVSHDRTLRVGTYTVDSVDQTGAGDAFNAGLVAAALDGKDLIEQLAWASAMGARATTRVGCHDGLPTRREFIDFMHANQISDVSS